MNKEYINKLHEMLKENIEPDIEDIYLADIEAKANNYKQALIDIRECCKTMSISFYKNNVNIEDIEENILQIIDKVLGDDK